MTENQEQTHGELSEEELNAELEASAEMEQEILQAHAAHEQELLAEASALAAAETEAVEPDPEAETAEPTEALETPEAADNEIITAASAEFKPVIEALLFVADEPLPFKQLLKILGEVDESEVRAALDELIADYDTRQSGFEIREIAGGLRLSTRPQYHEFLRKYLKSRPSAKLSLAALETLAVIAYKQPVTIPEILEIRGVSSSSAIRTLLEKRLIVTKGRKETVGRPMMYGTSRDFLLQFGLRDLGELPSMEDFEDLAG
ncbi:MAG: SMC-Scp complex subunit ScpB [Blastocatellia bacterium]